MMKNNYVYVEDYAIIKVQLKNNDCYNVLVDLEDLDKLLLTGKSVGIYFNTKKMPYARIAFRGKVYPLHRYLLDYEGELAIDHINNNSIDCRKFNLRIANFSTNAFNTKKNGNIGIKGITQIDHNVFLVSKIFDGITMERKCKDLDEAKLFLNKIDNIIYSYTNVKP